MDTRQGANLLFITILTLAIPAHARNCIKGKPCGKGCIALNKTCRIDGRSGSGDNTLRYDPGIRHGTIIHGTKHRLPTVHIVRAASVMASEAPNTKSNGGQHYKLGQRVFVYETYNNWARISNMQPEEWLELRYLEKLDE